MPPHTFDDEAQQQTRWWSSYPTTGFNERTRAGQTLEQLVEGAFLQPRCLAKSASATSLTYIRHAGPRTFQPLCRSTSYSALAPSHALPYDCRVAQRTISAFQAAKPHYDRWYLGAYAPAYWRDTHTYAYDQFYKWRSEHQPEKLARTWYHTGLEHKSYSWPLATSYYQGSQRHMRHYVRDRANYDSQLSRYVYNSYDQKADRNRFDRFMTGQPGAFVAAPAQLPRFQPSWHKYRLYKMNRRVVV